MRLTTKLVLLMLIVAVFTITQARADDLHVIKQLIQKLYKEDAKTLLCTDSSEGRNEKLIAVPGRYFSLDLMKYYRHICLENPKDSRGYTLWSEDPRTGQAGLFLFTDANANFTNLKIGSPKLAGSQGEIRVIYDFPGFSQKVYGSYTVFTLIKENGQWKIDDIELGGNELDNGPDTRSIQSLKQYLRKGLEKLKTKRGASPNR